MTTHQDADILLRLYELRRDEKMRKGRAFIVSTFAAENFQAYLSKYPPSSEEAALFRQVTSYWEMAASLVNQGAIDEKLFFHNNSEHFVVWEKVKHLVPEIREAYKNPLVLKNLESVAGRYQEWLSSEAPQAVEALRKRFGIKT